MYIYLLIALLGCPTAAPPVVAPINQNLDCASYETDERPLGAVNKELLAIALACRSHITQEVAASQLDIILDEIERGLIKGQHVRFGEFGSFGVTQRKAFTAPIKATGEMVSIPGRAIPVFRPGKGLKAAMNPPEKEASSVVAVPSVP